MNATILTCYDPLNFDIELLVLLGRPVVSVTLDSTEENLANLPPTAPVQQSLPVQVAYEVE